MGLFCFGVKGSNLDEQRLSQPDITVPIDCTAFSLQAGPHPVELHHSQLVSSPANLSRTAWLLISASVPSLRAPPLLHLLLRLGSTGFLLSLSPPTLPLARPQPSHTSIGRLRRQYHHLLVCCDWIFGRQCLKTRPVPPL